ncbi:uncharacterized protein DMAD_04951 [Drosophila madeirensis]|uniref:Uncharacterized protein n=1 Tax=Drosophila madeirensis TaxID=30013 RepID=A0AAU9GEI5_DROMD
MIAATLGFYLVLLAAFLILMAPTSEACFILLACLLRSPLCPYNTTAAG